MDRMAVNSGPEPILQILFILSVPRRSALGLEVGTDGFFNHVDRDLGDARLECEILRRITAAFWRGAMGPSG
jgi:hypothetical protein